MGRVAKRTPWQRHCVWHNSKIGSKAPKFTLIKADLSKSAQTDHLADTVDYVHLNKIVRQEMGIRSQLLEEVTKRILDRILIEIPLVNKADVCVSKLNPPIGGNVAMVTIEMSKKRTEL